MKSKCHKLIGVWCAKVESIAEEWSHELVPFDIWDAYFFCTHLISGMHTMIALLDLVPIQQILARFGTYSDWC